MWDHWFIFVQQVSQLSSHAASSARGTPPSALDRTREMDSSSTLWALAHLPCCMWLNAMRVFSVLHRFFQRPQ